MPKLGEAFRLKPRAASQQSDLGPWHPGKYFSAQSNDNQSDEEHPMHRSLICLAYKSRYYIQSEDEDNIFLTVPLFYGSNSPKKLPDSPFCIPAGGY
jgi:hypothetical protein